MNDEAMFANAKRAVSDQREAAQKVLDSAQAAADLAVLRRSADVVLNLAQTMALVKENPT